MDYHSFLIQQTINSIICEKSKQAGQLTLKEILDALYDAPRDYEVIYVFTDGGETSKYDRCPGDLYSYRGYYDHLALGFCEHKLVGELRARLKSAIGATFVGYKGGGQYKMDEDTMMWVSKHDQASGLGITLVAHDHENEVVTLLVSDIEVD